ncbi:MAG TPA: hypothetical protein VGQ68_01085 [Gaiellaceae bacterium]|nr:hypothetical protein [Gaiellaceae bacterium]
MEVGVRLIVVPSVGEADVICSLLRTEGIEAKFREALPQERAGGWGWWQEILVPEAALERARELIETNELLDS